MKSGPAFRECKNGSSKTLETEGLSEYQEKNSNAARTLSSIIITALMISAITLFVFVFGMNTWSNHYWSGNGSSPNKIVQEKVLLEYSSISALKENSTIVIEATVLDLNATFCSNPHPGCSADEPDYWLNVQSYLKGSGPQAVYVVDWGDAPSLAVGSKYVLFLKNDWTCPPPQPGFACALPPTPLDNTFYPIGSAQGKFLVEDNLVYSYKALYPQQYSWLTIDVDGVPLPQFEAEVRSANVQPSLLSIFSPLVAIPIGAFAAIAILITFVVVRHEQRKRSTNTVL